VLTAREQATAFLMAQVDVVMRYFATAADGMLLEEVVAKGPAEWRRHFVREFRAGKGRPLAELDHLADLVFHFFCRVHIWRYGPVSAGAVLDKVEEITPPTAREIADAWEVDSGSSEEGRRYFYGADGHPEDLIKSLTESIH
jgi:hypothetical protein